MSVSHSRADSAHSGSSAEPTITTASPAASTEAIRAAPAPTQTPDSRRSSLREQKKARSRQQILQAARDLIDRDGYAKTKMRDIAKEAGMSYQTLYNYFPTKGLILRELLTRNLVGLHRRIHSATESHESLGDKLRTISKEYVDAITPEERDLWREVCAERLKSRSAESCMLALLDNRAQHNLQQLLMRAQHQQQLDPHVDSSVLAGLLCSLVDATLIRYLIGDPRSGLLASLSSQLSLAVTPYLRAANG